MIIIILIIIISKVNTIISIMFNLLFIQNLSKFHTFLPVMLSLNGYFPLCPGKSREKVFSQGVFYQYFTYVNTTRGNNLPTLFRI